MVNSGTFWGFRRHWDSQQVFLDGYFRCVVGIKIIYFIIFFPKQVNLRLVAHVSFPDLVVEKDLLLDGARFGFQHNVSGVLSLVQCSHIIWS